MPRSLYSFVSSGWLPATLLAIATTVILQHYGTPPAQVAIFAAYVALGIALPGMLWVRWARGRPAHVAEDLTLGLATGYCLEIATYVVARAAGAPLLFLAWPIATLVLFAATPSLRKYWQGSGIRAPWAWSWSLAAMLGFILLYSARTFFAGQHLTGTDTPYVDMPFHLALIGELKNHVPPRIPYVPDVALAYHWFFYADAAATSWATGIDPATLLYRLSGLPMFVAFVSLTAAAAKRLTGAWWTGPVAVAIAVFGTVASPYRWTARPVFDSQTLATTWISPTNLFGLAMLAALILVFIDLLRSDVNVARRFWLLAALLVGGCAGAKASLLPLVIVGGVTAVGGAAVVGRRFDRRSAAVLGLTAAGLLVADLLIYRGATGGMTIGLDSLREFGVASQVGAQGALGAGAVVLPIAALLVALVLWSFLWAGAYGLLVRARANLSDPRTLLVMGICAGGLGVVVLLWYPGESQVYYLYGAAGAFGLLSASGIAALMPAQPRRLPLVAGLAAAAILGGLADVAIAALGSSRAPDLATGQLDGVAGAIMLPLAAMVGVVVVALVALRLGARRWISIRAATPLIAIALAMGFSLPNVISLVKAPISPVPLAGPAIPSDGIAAATWLQDNSGPDDLVATNMHCADSDDTTPNCDHRHFWVSAYSERRVLVEGWAYTSRSPDPSGPFWDSTLLDDNDAAFTHPSAATMATLRARYGVRWLLADLANADSMAVGRYAELRYRQGDFAVYELTGS